MARPERLELPTLWFEARCSIQLSYGRPDGIITLGARFLGMASGLTMDFRSARKQGSKHDFEVGIDGRRAH